MSAISPEREQFLQDILVTALEGGIGYWSTCLAYQPDDTYAEIVDSIEEESPTVLIIDRDVIVKGINAIINGDLVHESTKELIRSANRQNDAAPDDPATGDIDSDIADVIVQVGLFGEVVYG